MRELPMNTLGLTILLAILSIAIWTDMRSRLIPNWLTASGFCMALIVNFLLAGYSGVLTTLSGTVAGLAMFMPLYYFGKMGGGDVKLLGVCGAFLGISGVFWSAMWSLIAGGVLALAWVLYDVGLRSFFYRALATISLIQLPGGAVFQVPSNSPLKAKMPYAAAIAAGVLLSHWVE